MSKREAFFSENSSHFSIKKSKNNQIKIVEEKIFNVMNVLKNRIVLFLMSQLLVSNLENDFNTLLINETESTLNQNWNILNDLQLLYFYIVQLSASYSQHFIISSDVTQFSTDKSATQSKIKEQYQHYHNNYTMIF